MFLGVDLGTSGIKTVVLTMDGVICGQAAAPLNISRPRSGWSEQSPDDWWEALEACISALPADIRARITGIGLAGQMHGATLMGADDRPLRPAILWNDGRSFAECAELEAAEPKSRAITGNIAMPGFTAPKLAWVRKHEPELFAQIGSVLLPKDYIRLRLSGDKASDMSDSAGTLWLDVAARAWSEPLLAATGLTTAQMPRLYEGCEVTGQLRAEVAAAWGMKRVPIVGGGGDNAAGAAGIGVIGDNDALLSLGTSGVIFVATNEFRPNPARAMHAFCHCLPGMWHQMTVHLSAAACLDWAARATGVAGAGELLAMAARAEDYSGPELFLPYLSGERTPHNDPHVRGAFLRLDHDTTPQRLAAAVLEGVAFALVDGLQALREAGTRVDELAVIGGGSRSLHWGRILASALDARLVYLEGAEIGAALGAARLAQIAVMSAAPHEVCRRPCISHVVEPDPALADALAHKLAQFRAAYAAIRTI